MKPKACRAIQGILNTITLKCESDRLGFDQSNHIVVLTSETEQAWYGFPLTNPDCPILEWPKFAWKQVS